jgi:hypothetical protein
VWHIDWKPLYKKIGLKIRLAIPVFCCQIAGKPQEFRPCDNAMEDSYSSNWVMLALVQNMKRERLRVFAHVSWIYELACLISTLLSYDYNLYRL